VAVLGSSAIELVQVIPVLHRDASLVDVVSNGLGGLIGALLAHHVVRRRGTRDRRPTSTSRP
jgi:VanZ family protein